MPATTPAATFTTVRSSPRVSIDLPALDLRVVALSQGLILIWASLLIRKVGLSSVYEAMLVVIQKPQPFWHARVKETVHYHNGTPRLLVVTPARCFAYSSRSSSPGQLRVPMRRIGRARMLPMAASSGRFAVLPSSNAEGMPPSSDSCCGCWLKSGVRDLATLKGFASLISQKIVIFIS